MSSETNLAIVMSESILITWQHYSKESQLFGMRRIRIGTELNLIKRHKRYFELLLYFEILWAKSYALIHINIVWTYKYLYTFHNNKTAIESNIDQLQSIIRWGISILHNMYCL